MSLFGFSTVDERSLFLDLISVSGVGPKGALKILSGVPVSSFVEFLENEDVTALSSIPGLGKKTAQKIILHNFSLSRLTPHADGRKKIRCQP